MSNNTVVFINVLEVEPARKQELVDLLKEGTENVIRARSGFVSSAIFASADGSRVVNMARWRSAEDIKATQGDPKAAQYAERALEIARPSPGVYTLVAEYEGAR